MAAWGQTPDAVLEAQQRRIEAIASATRSAICVFGPGGKGGGSGVVISADGYALTNYHVAQPSGAYMQCSMSDNQLYDAVIVGIDPGGDVALIKLLGRDDFPAASLADSDRAQVGNWCFAIGNPFLLATDFQPTVSYGIISGVHRYQYPAGTLLEYADCIQTDAAINPGNSGGPLFNADGHVIGINGRGSFEKRGRVNVGVGYAISINQIKKFLGHLHSGRIVDHATLGATVATDEDGQVVVANILDSSDAFRRGLRYGDQIVAFGGRQITTVNGFKNALGTFPKGWRIPLSYRRDGERANIYVRLSGVHSREELIAKVQPTKRTPKKKQPMPGDPKPGEPKQPGAPEGDKPKQPIPIPIPKPRPKAPKVKIPDHVKKLLEARSGYANYYFNKLNRNRVWDSFTAGKSFTGYDGEWVLRGELLNAGEFTMTLRSDISEAAFPTGEVSIDGDNKQLGDQLVPRGSGGMLVALHLWRRLLVLGPEKYGEVYYEGTAPVLGREDLCDVLVGTFEITETRFYFDRESGRLVLIEMFPDINADPCEIYIREEQEVNSLTVPARLDVQFGDSPYGTLKIDQFQSPEEKEAS
jgi:S1-C subfamily serine protease